MSKWTLQFKVAICIGVITLCGLTGCQNIKSLEILSY